MTTVLIIIACVIGFIYYCINGNFRHIINSILRLVTKLILNIFILSFYRLAEHNILLYFKPISKRNILDYLSTSAIVITILFFQYWHVAILVSSLVLIPFAVGKVLKHEQHNNPTIDNQSNIQQPNIQPSMTVKKLQDSTMSNDFLMPDFSNMNDKEVLDQVGYIPKQRRFTSFIKKNGKVQTWLT